MSAQHHGLPNLKRRLGQSRIRAQVNLVLAVLIWNGAGVALSYILLRLSSLWGYDVPGPGWGWIGLVLLVGVVAGGIWIYLRTPTQLELARRADRLFSLNERSSTALELQAGPLAKHTPLAFKQAVQKEADSMASRIDPRQLAPTRAPRLTWLAVTLVALATVLQWGFPLRQAPNLPPVSLTEAERADVVTRLATTAELLSEEAEQRQDPYLKALSQAFRDLGDQVEAGVLDKGATQLELDRLMDHLAKAYGNDPVATDPVAAPEADDPTTPPLAGEASQAQAPPTAASPAPDLSGLLEQLGQVEQDLQIAKANREAAQGQITLADLQEFGPYLTPESLAALKQFQERREQEALRAGQPIGAAQESTAGAGDLAGEGTQDLGTAAAPDAFAGLETQSEDVLLPEVQTPEGDKVRLELSPETKLTEVADEASTASGSWRAKQEAKIRQDFLLPRDRAVASRYFDRPATSSATP